MAKYYVLIQRDEYGLWWPQFGDYDRDIVKEELRDWVESGMDNYSALRVISCKSDDQSSIDAAIANINAEVLATV